MKRYLILLLIGTLVLSQLSATQKVRRNVPPVKVACVGNSITFGTLLPDTTASAYPARLQQLLGDGYRVGNYGFPGATLLTHGHRPYIHQQVFHRALDSKSDIVIIHLGVNDTDPRNWPNYGDEFVQDYCALIDSFRVANPQCRILIALTSPLSHRHHRFESGTRDWQDRINYYIPLIAQRMQVELIDFYTPLLPFDHYFTDAVHPNREGHDILARVAYQGITGDFGGLHLSDMYGDHMVLQHGRRLTIRGHANAGEPITLQIAGQQVKAVTGTDGNWKATLKPLSAGGPYTLTVTAPSRTLVYRDVMAGEVWLCSGQSNMAFELKDDLHGDNSVRESTNDRLRLFAFMPNWPTQDLAWEPSALDSLNRLQYFTTTGWQAASPETTPAFSAVAYYFGKTLQDSLHIPVGLICNAIGGAPIESFIDRPTLNHSFPAILRDWTRNDFIQDWVRGRAKLNISRSNDPLQRHPYQPCYLFDTGILPLEHFPVKGIIWYQGESNAHNVDAHEKLFKLLVNNWRDYWGEPQLPFYYVQLSSLFRPSWPRFRDSQRRLLTSLPSLGMAVCTDVGDSLNVHPSDKQTVGRRLASWALHRDYHFNHVVPSGPLYRNVSFGQGAATLYFDYAQGLHAADEQPLRTFEIAGWDEVFYPATAEIQPDGSIRVSAPEVEKPAFVRYGWQPFTRANLVNGVGLPASTFLTDKPLNDR